MSEFDQFLSELNQFFVKIIYLSDFVRIDQFLSELNQFFVKIIYLSDFVRIDQFN